MKHYYAETDGQVYLIEEEGKLRFPKSLDELFFEVEKTRLITIGKEKVVYCRPKLSSHPYDWWHKDEIPAMNRVDPLVRKAVNTTLPRVVTEAVVKKKGKILLVKPKRGYTKGKWTLPGGFAKYGESPIQSLKRELKEEVGVEGKIEKLLTVESKIGERTNFHWYMFFYQVSLPHENFSPSQDEIEEVRWFNLKEGIISLGDGLMAHTIKKLYNPATDPKLSQASTDH